MPNRLTNMVDGVGTTIYGYDAAGQLLTEDGPWPSDKYDLNGNLLSDGLRCFAWDDENQLISVWVTNAWRSDFQYDGRMRRRVRRVRPMRSLLSNQQFNRQTLPTGGKETVQGKSRVGQPLSHPLCYSGGRM
jgi:hypothetical protein